MDTEFLSLVTLRKEYYEVVAVNDVDLGIREGDIFGLVGPNGAGKTTLLRMLATALEPTAGRAVFRGKDIWDDPVSYRGVIGFMPDFFQLYDYLTTRETLLYFGLAHGLDRKTRTGRADEMLKVIGLEEKAHSLAKGLSRGMVQRLGLGRALIHRPKLLLLDEPASGLDPLARKQLFDVLREVNAQGTTIIISSHILGELSDVCNSVGIMHYGRFLAAGEMSEIVRKIMPKRRISLLLTTDPQAARTVLQSWPTASVEQVEGPRVRLLLEGTDAELARLNAALVAAGVGVALIEETRTGLEELYLAITERQGHAAAS
ncbi:MAG: ABC transporter ATP-binding protein [Phycisphaerae bacterium]|nr:ABC transporter ATP-binding protein [Phycisphaerae bacterium]